MVILILLLYLCTIVIHRLYENTDIYIYIRYDYTPYIIAYINNKVVLYYFCCDIPLWTWNNILQVFHPTPVLFEQSDCIDCILFFLYPVTDQNIDVLGDESSRNTVINGFKRGRDRGHQWYIVLAVKQVRKGRFIFWFSKT